MQIVLNVWWRCFCKIKTKYILIKHVCVISSFTKRLLHFKDPSHLREFIHRNVFFGESETTEFLLKYFKTVFKLNSFDAEN